ncbi:MAG: CHAP domain-containing protein [Furfurilactobacillus sp.]|jgi:surface antigen|uniref:CHAP domain-containing protein n=1 Tax=Furfurilactobacillus milii TaxID=2888272 RepID=A0ABT6DBK0_9LACO|nr:MULTISPECIES: CHAP domain-containing protein [Furfurilactobacillus]QLE67011.1 Choline binding protein A [Furfurilactobacillus rossiae]MCF6161271.1 CHAP domain-containing protein [Furfurilactobacillus milii]MCF6163651.1 CHAP domain-containing protein [Furfurilactobacillus milii]MCF6418978.1 CHAP domain-containing protein [Furfurilactobacillus milii]MCH4011210.1 CHAP domain-containing protein [Furfurilactobacillus sp.]
MKLIKQIATSLTLVGCACGITVGLSNTQVSADQVSWPGTTTVQTTSAVQNQDSGSLITGNISGTHLLSGQALMAAKQAGQQGFYDGIDGYPVGQCTGFVAAVLRQQQIPVNTYSYLGNGDQWAESATQRGLLVDFRPTVGSVVSFKSMHVAYVTEVNDITGTFNIMEGNFEGQALHERTLTMNDDIAGIIHFEKLSTASQSTFTV